MAAGTEGSAHIQDAQSFLFPQASRERVELLPHIPQNGCHVLVVEDNMIMQKVLIKWLKNLGIRTSQAFDGMQAVVMSQKEVYDLILMDISLPNMDGVRASKAIRHDSQNVNTPIIGFSAYATADDIREAEVNDFLTKPISISDLIRTINKWYKSNSTNSFLMERDIHRFTNNQPADAPHFLFDNSILEALADNRSGAQPTRTTALVVEDNSVTQRVISTFLKKMDVDVLQCFNGNEAVEACQEKRFDMIWMDMSMPVMNGITATHIIRNTDNLNRQTPIIAFSSYGSREEYSALGLSDYLQKPFTKDDLAEMVKKWRPFPGNSPNSGADLKGGANGSLEAVAGGLGAGAGNDPSGPLAGGAPLAGANDVGRGVKTEQQVNLILDNLSNSPTAGGGSGTRGSSASGASGAGNLMGLGGGGNAFGSTRDTLGSSGSGPGAFDFMGMPTGAGVPNSQKINGSGPGGIGGPGAADFMSAKKVKTNESGQSMPPGAVGADMPGLGGRQKTVFEERRDKGEMIRMSHNSKERMRRKEIVDAVHWFRNVIPGGHDKMDKASVLKIAVEYYRVLELTLGEERLNEIRQQFVNCPVDGVHPLMPDGPVGEVMSPGLQQYCVRMGMNPETVQQETMRRQREAMNQNQSKESGN
eukprot:Clim_evm32s7 gene=Clim_evmTU32s7